MNQSDTIDYRKTGFDNEKYLSLQTEEILKRIEKVGGRLYLEIGGKFPLDPHGARVLPGFKVDNKVRIIKRLKGKVDIIFCVSAIDIIKNRQLSNTKKSYVQSTLDILNDINEHMGTKPLIAINLINEENHEIAIQYANQMKELGYETYNRFQIAGYPNNSKILSAAGYGLDDYIKVDRELVIVIGAASNSGKMSTCLGQIFLESKMGIQSGYAKYETFPIWNLPLNHPVNLAYEAATADINDYNIIDEYHLKNNGVRAVNYNRDVEAFNIVHEILDPLEGVITYNSPTEMGISTAGFAITDDEIVSIASLREIERRAKWYKEILGESGYRENWIELCERAKEKALSYINDKGYDLNLSI